jgi:hypothetical protein
MVCCIFMKKTSIYYFSLIPVSILFFQSLSIIFLLLFIYLFSFFCGVDPRPGQLRPGQSCGEGRPAEASSGVGQAHATFAWAGAGVARAVTQYTTVYCSVQVVDITLTKYRFINITSLRMVQQEHCGSATLHIYD